MVTVQMFLAPNEFSFFGVVPQRCGRCATIAWILHFFDEAESGVSRLPREEAPL
jgi:hypothetical protein